MCWAFDYASGMPNARAHAQVEAQGQARLLGAKLDKAAADNAVLSQQLDQVRITSMRTLRVVMGIKAEGARHSILRPRSM